MSLTVSVSIIVIGALLIWVAATGRAGNLSQVWARLTEPGGAG